MTAAKLPVTVEHETAGAFDPRASKGTRITRLGVHYTLGRTYAESDAAMAALIARCMRPKCRPVIHVVSPAHQIVVWEDDFGVAYQHYRDGEACGLTSTSGSFEDILRHVREQWPSTTSDVITS